MALSLLSMGPVSVVSSPHTLLVFLWCFENNNNNNSNNRLLYLFHMKGPICVVFWVEALISFSYEKKLILSRTTTVPVSTLSCISLTNSCPLRPRWANPVSCFCFSKSCFKQISENQGWKALGSSRKGGFYMHVCVCQIMRGYAWEFANHLTG